MAFNLSEWSKKRISTRTLYGLYNGGWSEVPGVGPVLRDLIRHAKALGHPEYLDDAAVAICQGYYEVNMLKEIKSAYIKEYPQIQPDGTRTVINFFNVLTNDN